MESRWRVLVAAYLFIATTATAQVITDDPPEGGGGDGGAGTVQIATPGQFRHDVCGSGFHQVLLRWQSVSSAQQYLITRVTENPPRIIVLDAGTTSYHDTNGPYDIYAGYTIEAIDQGGVHSTRSDQVNARWLESPVIDAVAASDNVGTPISITWSYRTTGPQPSCSFRLYRRETVGVGSGILVKDNIAVDNNNETLTTTYSESVPGTHEYGISGIRADVEGPIVWDSGSTAPLSFSVASQFEHTAGSPCYIASCSGGTPPYTYFWERFNCSTGTCSPWGEPVTTTTSLLQTQSCSSVWPSPFRLRCTITDSANHLGVIETGYNPNNLAFGEAAKSATAALSPLQSAQKPDLRVEGRWLSGSRHALQLSANQDVSGARISAEVFDVVGRKRASLRDNSFSPNSRTLNWSLPKLERGTFWVRMSVGNQEWVSAFAVLD